MTPASGSVRIPITVSASTLTYVENLAVTRLDAGRLSVQVTPAVIALPCPGPATGSSHYIDLELTNVGGTQIDKYTPQVMPIIIPGVTLTLASSGTASIDPNGGTTAIQYRLNIASDFASQNMGTQVSGTVGIKILYETSRNRDPISSLVPVAITIPIQVSVVETGGFVRAGAALTHDFGKVEMQRPSSLRVQFREACGYRAVSMSADEVDRNAFAITPTVQTIIAAGGSAAMDFGVLFTPGGGASVCKAERWSYRVVGSAAGSQQYTQLFNFSAQPAFQDMTVYKGELQAAADRIEPHDAFLRRHLLALRSHADSHTQAGSNCSDAPGETALLVGVLQPLAYATRTLDEARSKMAASDYPGASAAVLGGAAATRAIANQCAKITRLAVVASDCHAATGALASHWTTLANQARENFKGQLGPGANQQTLLDAHAGLGLIYRALGQTDQAKDEEQEAAAASQRIQELRTQAAYELDQATNKPVNPWLFGRIGGTTIAWNPLGYVSLQQERASTEQHFTVAIDAYLAAGDVRSAQEAQEALTVTQGAYGRAQLASQIVLGAWVVVFLLLGIHLCIQTIGFSNDQRRIALGYTLFTSSKGGM
jgi:tetratricopeptide (TPR) repeat protein